MLIAKKDCIICHGNGLVGTYYHAIDENDVEPCECVYEESNILLFNSTQQKYVSRIEEEVVFLTSSDVKAVVFSDDKTAQLLIDKLNQDSNDQFTMVLQ